jgi:hypothetical protein
LWEYLLFFHLRIALLFLHFYEAYFGWDLLL